MLFYSAYVLTYNVRALMLWKHEEDAIKRTTKKACMDGHVQNVPMHAADCFACTHGLVNFAVIVHGTLPA
jgi:hypothetical protein